MAPAFACPPIGIMPRPFDATLPGSADRSRAGLAISLALHAIIVLALLLHAELSWKPYAAPGLRTVSDDRGGGGGGRGGEGNRVAYITLPSAAPAKVARPPHVAARAAPVPVPVRKPDPPVVTPTSTVPPIPTEAAPDSIPEPPDSVVPDPTPQVAGGPSAAQGGAGTGTGSGGGSGTGQGRGVGAGRGAGSGPGDGGGGGGTGTAPEPRQLVLPPEDVPKELKGRSLQVTFWIGAGGQVQRIAVAPAISNGKFARKFEDTMRNYRFRPARSPAGFPVAGSTTLTVAFY